MDCLVSAFWNVTSFLPQVGPFIKQPAPSCSIRQPVRRTLGMGVPVPGAWQPLQCKRGIQRHIDPGFGAGSITDAYVVLGEVLLCLSLDFLIWKVELIIVPNSLHVCED